MKAIAGSQVGAWILGCVASALVQAQTTVGRTQGEASISATGAARYLVPLRLPPGTNGLVPQLAVTYDSRGGNGLLGAGFQLSGFSVIERCARTLAQDGTIGAITLTGSDRYCLDGKRLRLVSGTYGVAGSRYQTEVEEFSRLTAYGTAGNGPAYFQLEGRDGRIYEYGATAASRIESEGSATARAWALNRVRDRSGNYVDFVYAEDGTNGSYRPIRIDYTGNTAVGAAPYYTVRLLYEARPETDVSTGYLAGGRIVESQRLARIEVAHVGSNSILRRYEFSYEANSSNGRSRLARLQECSAAECLPATTFAWESYFAGWGLETNTGIGTSAGSTVMPGDSNGDGSEDLTYFDSATGRWYLLPGSIQGYVGPPIVMGPGSSTSAAEAVNIDLEGNGKRALLLPGYSLTAGPIWLWLHASSNNTYVYSQIGLSNVSAPGGTIAADIDGDGREDIVYARKNSTSIFWRRNLTAGGTPAFAAEAVLWTSPYSSTTPSTPFGTNPLRFRSVVRRGDFNGDGRADLLFMQQYSCTTTPSCYGSWLEWHALVSQGTTLVTRGIFQTNAMPVLGDFNGDGLSDVAYSTVDFDGTIRWILRFATGAAAYGSPAFTADIATPVTTPDYRAVVLDADGDGRTDLLYPTADSTWQYCHATGTTFEACRSAGSITDSFSGAPLATDYNGDGAVDIVYPTTTGWRALSRMPNQRNTLASITDGHGNQSRFTYATLADRSVYSLGTGAVFPVRDLFSPMVVVSKLVQSDGIGGTYPTSMTYEGARIHLQGRGFLGFARRTMVDGRTGLARVEETRQDPASFETLGQPATLLWRQANGLPLERRTFTWARKEFGAGTELRRFPYVSALVLDRYELDGTRIASTSVAQSYDEFGAPTDRTTTVTEIARGSNTGAQHVQRVTSTLLNDVANWCLGRPVSVVERRSHSLAGGAEVVRTQSQSWDGVRCRPTQTQVEPGSASLQVTTDYIYDAFGNTSSESITPAGQAARRTSFTWTENGRFLGSVDAPEAHLYALGWNPVTALQTQVRDPNGLITQWQYDAFDRLTRQIDPDGTSLVLERSWCGTGGCPWPGTTYFLRQSRRSVGGTNLRIEETGYDSFDRAVYYKGELPGGSYAYSVRRFDALGRTTQQSIPADCCVAPGQWEVRTYDVIGRLASAHRPTSETDSTRATTSYRYDGHNRFVTDALGRVTGYFADTLGQVLRVVDPAGADTDYEYDAFGNLLKVRDVAGNETVSNYNPYGLRTRLVDVDSGTWTYTYSPMGELTAQTNARGQTTTYLYDLLGRPVTRTEAEGVTSWRWGHSPAAWNVGTLESVTAPGFQESYAYDSRGRASRVTRTVAGTTLVTAYGYDANTGLLDTLTYPSVAGVTPFRLRHVHDRDRLVKLVDADNAATVFWQLGSVNPAGQVTSATLGNGVRVNRRYDAVTALPTAIASGPNGTATLQNLAYSWDPAGNLRDRTDLNRGLVEQFAYDSRDRLDFVTRAGVTTLDLAYDDIGNITFKSDVGTYRYDTVRKHAVVSAGTNLYAYDANGVLTSATGSALGWYSYDLPSLVAHPNGNYSAFYYGADRSRYRHVARAGSTLTDTLYALDGRYERFSGGGTVNERQYILADDAFIAVRSRAGTATPTVTYVLSDHLGGVDAFVSGSGSLLAKTSYQPLGARRSGDWLSATPTSAEWQQINATTPRGYTAHEHVDNLGLIHMNGRVYDPVLGRFLSPDPYVQSPYDAQTLNRYSYVRNNPLRYTDPSGYCFNTHPAADHSYENCLEEIFVRAFGISTYSMELNNYNSLVGDLVGQAANVPSSDLQSVDSASPGSTPTENIFVYGSSITAESVRRSTSLGLVGVLTPESLVGSIGFRSLAMSGLGAIGAGALLMPAAISADSDTLDEDGGPRSIYHFTNDLGREGIVAQGAILPGKSGLVYFSPIPYPNAAAAQQALALPRAPTGYFSVPRQNVASQLMWTSVQPNYGQPGGGFEASTPFPVPMSGAVWVPLRP